MGHVRRMDNNRIPRQVLLGELSEGKRLQGRPLLIFKDIYKASMKDFSISPNNWEEIADDRGVWTTTTSKGARVFEKTLRSKLQYKRNKRKAKGHNNIAPN